MILKYGYWFFKNALNNDQCQFIIDHGLSQKTRTAITGTEIELLEKNKNKKKLTKKELESLKKVRNSEIAFIDDKFLYQLITPFIYDANKNSGWNFKIDWHEKMQFTKYRLNQHYDWHQDGFVEPYKNPDDPNFDNKIRKLSTVVFLSDPKDYEGGEFCFNFFHPKNEDGSMEVKEIKSKGSILVFPSFMWHCVKPVTKGTRYSLVSWSIGPSFV